MAPRKSAVSRAPVMGYLRRAAPPLAFLLAICLLVVFCYDSGHTSLPPTEKRYVTAKAGIAALRQDKQRNMQREPWERLAGEFRSIYDADPAWPNRPAALFRAAETLEELARRSCARSDARKAIASYETLALRHAQSRLADDALFRAAKLRAAYLKDDAGALTLINRIKKQYPKGDMVENALALEKAIRASASGRTAADAVKKVANAGADPLDDMPAATPRKGFAGDLPLRFKGAKSRAAALRDDNLRACWRQPWELLREEFLSIHKKSKNNLAAQSLFEAACAQKKLAECSRLSADRKKAVEMFLKVASSYPRHAVADDALYQAAHAQGVLGKERAAAIANLEKLLTSYPQGDMAVAARKLLAAMNIKNQAAPARTIAAAKIAAEQPELQVLSWDSISKNSVEIVLEMSAPAKYAARLEKGTTPKLIVDLDNAAVVNDVRKGVTVNGSLLKAVRVMDRKGGASVQLDFRDVRNYKVRSETDPCRIIVNVAAGKAPLPSKTSSTSMQASKRDNNILGGKVTATQMQDMASQLGLTVQRVFIDPGHGGRDPGTTHNKIVERVITLDVAMALGRLLEANGLEVVYSRKTDKSVPLSERTRMANDAHADIFVSIHMNASENAAAAGFETYYLDLATNAQAARVAMLENAASDKRLGDMHSMLAEVMLHARANESRNLAADIQRLSLFRLKKRDYNPRNNGVKSAPFHVLLGAKMPAVLVEIGYCSNLAEARNLATASYRHAIAEGLAEGILAYRDRLVRNRTAQTRRGNG